MDQSPKVGSIEVGGAQAAPRGQRDEFFSSWRGFLVLGLWLALLCGVVSWRLAPPAPLGLSAPVEALSATRAVETLGLILGNAEPHPVGSQKNLEVRRRIEQELRHLGYTPELQHAQSCHPGFCGELYNVFVKVPGARPELSTLLLSAHYDSVPAGPGVSDDGIGVAGLLELARALKHRPAPARPLILLFTDGEETGMLGMRAFTEHPAFKPVEFNINVEARGASGLSLLFESSPGDLGLIREFASASERPLTNSLFQAVYGQLPNDTDFSLVLGAGRRGVNFALIEGFHRYHTPQDDLSHLNLGSLQHSLNNLDGAFRGFNQPLPEASSARVSPTYFDFLGLGLVWLPGFMSWVLLLGSLLLFLGLGVGLRRKISWRICLIQLGFLLLGLIACVALGLGADWVLKRLGRLPDMWVAKPSAIWLGAIALGICGHFIQSLGPKSALVSLERSLVVGVFFSLLGVAVLLFLPGAAYIIYIPALLLAWFCMAGFWLRQREGKRETLMLSQSVSGFWLRGVLLFALPALIWLPNLLLLYPAIGFISLAVHAAAWNLLLSVLLPLSPQTSWRGALGAFSVAVGIFGFSTLQAPYTEEHPQRASVGVYYDIDRQAAQSLVDIGHGPAPARLAEALTLSPEASPSFPWFGGWYDKTARGRAEWASPARSELRVVERVELPDGLKLKLSWQREAWAEALSLSLPSHVNAQLDIRNRDLYTEKAPPDLVISARDEHSSYQRWVYYGYSRAPLELTLSLKGARGVKALVCEHRFELPDELARLVLATRPSSATAAQYGDNSVICREELF